MNTVTIPAYLAVVYHDTEYDAAASSTCVGTYPTVKTATRAILAMDREHWQTGSIHKGWRVLEQTRDGLTIEDWEDDEKAQSWFVGVDGKAVRG